MSAALTPRVRTIVVCDEAVGSEIEENVFTLEGARLGFFGEAIPCVRALTVYLVLSYARGGRFEGEVKLVPAGEDRTIRISRFAAEFDASPAAHAVAVDLGTCTFPEPGTYLAQVWFRAASGDVLKGEAPFQVRLPEE